MNPSSAGANKDSEQQEEEEQLQESPDTLVDNSDSPPAALEAAAEAGGGDGGEEAAEAEGMEDPMEEDAANPATVFCIRLKQPRSNLMHKMSVPELCRNFR